MHVYCATNRANGKIYIGQTKHRKLDQYWRGKLNTLEHSGHCPLQRAIKKYGIDGFDVVTLVHPVDTEQMDELEKFFIRTCESQNPEIGYNLAAGGQGARGVVQSPQSNEQRSRALIGRPKSAKHRANQRKSRIGWKPSPLCVARSIASRSKRKKTISPETRAKISHGRRTELTDRQKQEIRLLRQSGLTMREIGERFSRSTARISMILNQEL